MKVRIIGLTELIELNLLDIGHDYRFSQSNRNNHSTANRPGVVVRHYLELTSQKNTTAAKQVQLGLTKDCRKDLKAIMGRKDLGDALAALKDISGLWVQLKGATHLMSLQGYDAVSILYYLVEISSRPFRDQSITSSVFAACLILSEKTAIALSKWIPKT